MNYKSHLVRQSSRSTENQRALFAERSGVGWLGGFSGFRARFSRFGWDVLGLNLLALALITLLGLRKLSGGFLIQNWVTFLNHWVGIGSYLIALTIGLLGLAALRKTIRKPFKFNLGVILSLEGFSFCLIALATIAGGHLLENAEQGKDGGVIGWGLVELLESFLPPPWSTVLLIFLLVIFFLFGTTLMGRLVKLIERWLLAAEEQPVARQKDVSARTVPMPRESPQAVAAQLSTAHESLEIGKLRKVGQRKKDIRQPVAVPEEADFAQKRDENLPSLDLLVEEKSDQLDEVHIHEAAAKIEKTLSEFGIPARVVGFRVGPTVTQFAVEPGFVEKKRPDGTVIQQKVRVSQIATLNRDLALALSAERLRIETPVPGYSFIGIEAPNPVSTTVRLRPLLESDAFIKLEAPLAIAMGRSVSGLPVVADLSRMPHLLIAGTTGSGKSVCVQALAACLAFNNTPDNLRMVMLDPKMVELARFDGLPHLLGKVETDIERMLGIMRWALVEMDNRYRLLEAAGARDMEGYNRRARRRKEKTFPSIVIFIDELADLMMSAPDQTEHSLTRLAQMARATSIHLVVATQRPSTDVITGSIKANFPARVAFSVASAVDSRVILDTNGAETLLGSGDMLFLNPEVGMPIRAQGVFVTDQEIERIIEHWKKLKAAEEEEESEARAPWEEHMLTEEDDADNLVQQAVDIVRKAQRASASMLQRRLRIGYPRAARLIDELEVLGVVGPSQGGGREREVLIPREEDDNKGEEDEGPDEENSEV